MRPDQHLRFLHVRLDISMAIGCIIVRDCLYSLIRKPLQQQAALEVGVDFPEYIQLGKERFQCGRIDSFEPERVDVDMLVGGAGSIVFTEEVEEGCIHEGISRHHADVTPGRTESFQRCQMRLALLERPKENRIDSNDGLRQFNIEQVLVSSRWLT